MNSTGNIGLRRTTKLPLVNGWKRRRTNNVKTLNIKVTKAMQEKEDM